MKLFGLSSGKKKRKKRSSGFLGSLFGKSKAAKRQPARRTAKKATPKDKSPFRRTNAVMRQLEGDPKKAIDWAVRNNYSPSYTDGRGVERWKHSGRRVYKKK